MATAEREPLYRYDSPIGQMLALTRTHYPREGWGELRIEAAPRVSVTVSLRPPELELLAHALGGADEQTRCLGCGGDLVQLGMSTVHLGGRRYAYTCQGCGWIHSQEVRA